MNGPMDQMNESMNGPMDQTDVPRTEVVPEVRELINDFYSSRYPSCLACLESMKPQLALDIHLHDHVDSLYEQIRHRRGGRAYRCAHKHLPV